MVSYKKIQLLQYIAEILTHAGKFDDGTAETAQYLRTEHIPPADPGRPLPTYASPSTADSRVWSVNRCAKQYFAWSESRLNNYKEKNWEHQDSETDTVQKDASYVQDFFRGPSGNPIVVMRTAFFDNCRLSQYIDGLYHETIAQ